MGKSCKARVIVSGRVQGVFYRQATKDKAVLLGLSGWVRNEPDGTVSLETIGPRESIEALVAWCHDGPPSARVEKVEVDWLELTGDELAPTGFRIDR